MDSCVFCKIINGEIPSKIVYQDDKIAVFHNNKPAAPIHLLIIPKEHVEDFIDVSDEIVLRIKSKIVDLVSELKLSQKGYRVLVNGGTAKAVYHLHFHLLGGVTVEREV